MRATKVSRAADHLSALLVGCAAAALVLQLAVVPLWLLPTGTAWGWVLVPLALLTTPHWSLIHEAIHGSLLRNRTWNDHCGRALAVGYGVPFALLKTGHLLHHRYSRTARERTEVYDPATSTWAATAPGYYARLLGGLYLAEVATVVLAVAPRTVWQRLARQMDSPRTVTGIVLDRVSGRLLRQFRIDAAAAVAVHLASAVAYGRHAWMFGAAIAGRAVLISVADNSYHYSTELDAPLEAMNLRLPRALEAFVLAFNLHAVHHRHPGVRWHDLRAVFVADDDRFHLGWFTAVARQMRGPIAATSPRLGRGSRPDPHPDRRG